MRRRIRKGKIVIPPGKFIYDKTGKDSILKYIEWFDRLNVLVPGGTVVNGKRI